MKKDIQVPEIGESVSEGILAAWLKSDGDRVSEAEEIFELETDKATLAVPSPAAGTLHISAAEGEEVAVGQVVGTIDDAGDNESAGSESGEDRGDKGAAREPDSEKPAGAKADAKKRESTEGGEAQSQDVADRPLSPAVRRIVEEYELNPATIDGTGPAGRITKEDALKAAKSGGGKQDSGRSKPQATQQEAASSGPAGDTGKQPASAGADKPAARPQADPGKAGQQQRRVPMSSLRKRIAANLVASKQNSAHVTTVNEVDMSAVMEIRSKHRDAFQERHGVRLGFMSFFVKASQFALEQSPEVNAFLDENDIIYNDAVNIGVALSSDKGLLTPVLKDVANLSFADIEGKIVDFIARANERKLMPDEMMGATFTISNGGVFGSMLSTPIPSPPQTAVLGMHAIEKRPVVVDDEIVIRPMMYLALTYDHRMIDGREAVGFLGRIKKFVEDPTELLLEL